MSIDSLEQLRTAVAGFAYNDYLRHLPSVEQQTPDGRPLRVAVLRSYTAEPIEPVLKLRLLLDGFRPSFWFGGFNQYVQELLETSGGLQTFRPDVILLLVRLEELLPDFVEQFPSQSAADWEQRLAAKAQELVSLAGRAAGTCFAQVIIQNASLSQPYFGIFDAQQRDGQQQLASGFNRELSAAAAATAAVRVWDFEGLCRRKGSETLEDPKLWYVSRNPFKQSAYPAIAGDLLRYVRSAVGLMKKCVVVDLDNTLWGGIVGEDGLEGIKLGHTYPGNCYRDFQRELLKLHDRGILLAINSKNNEADALRVIDEHPDQVLRRHHFAARRINWDDKGSNLRAIARELNIGVDSLIFVDDNPVECELVRRECPECEVILLPGKPYLLPGAPASWLAVENIRLTAEDRQRGELYRVQSARKEDEERFTNLDDFLRSLEMSITIERATAFSIPRIAQLTQKTNQLNMTTRRYTESQIQAFVQDPDYDVLSISARDRFGDHGIIGVLMLQTAGESARIDTFLLSCRVIGRGIEQAMLACAADLALAKGAVRLVGEFIPTAKNEPAAGIYARQGLTPVSETLYTADLQQVSLPYPEHTNVTRPDRAAQPARS